MWNLKLSHLDAMRSDLGMSVKVLLTKFSSVSSSDDGRTIRSSASRSCVSTFPRCTEVFTQGNRFTDDKIARLLRGNVTDLRFEPASRLSYRRMTECASKSRGVVTLSGNVQDIAR